LAKKQKENKMKTNIQVTVIFPQTFQFEVDLPINEDDIENIQQQIKDFAGQLMESSQSDPIITNCDDVPELEE